MNHLHSPDGASPTPLLSLPLLAEQLQVSVVLVKAENCRPLGNFKSLGGSRAARLALARLDVQPEEGGIDRVLICASDGNHGLSVAAAAQEAGVGARIYLPQHVPAERAARIADMGATIVWVQGTYDNAVLLAQSAAGRGEGILIADTTDDPGDIVVADVMAGYGVISDEIITQIDREKCPAPTHLFAQAGVGGFAAAMAEGLRPAMANPRKIIVVEPEKAACVAAGLADRKPVQIDGLLDTCADMLSCGTACAPALNILLRHQAVAVQVSEAALLDACNVMQRAGGPPTTPSGAAGLAGMIAACNSPGKRALLGLDDRSVVLLFVTEGQHRKEIAL